MIKNLTTSQILLIVTATVLFLLIGFSFYLLQNPSAPLFFAPPSASETVAVLSSPSTTPAPSSTSAPTRQTSYTPFASAIASPSGTLQEVTSTPETGTPVLSSTATTGAPTSTNTLQPGPTATATSTPTAGTVTATPEVSPTLIPGEHGVTGRVIQKGTPVADVDVAFYDDDPPRENNTDQGGHYWFTTLAPGTTFILSYSKVDNPQVTPAAEIAEIATIEGTLPTGVDIITLPDLEISTDLEGMIFELQAPTSGATYSAAAINQTNPLQFVWSTYNQADAYLVELGKAGSNETIWTSSETTASNLMWNGTLDDGSHIVEGLYWWRVVARKSLGNYDMFIHLTSWVLQFNP